MDGADNFFPSWDLLYPAVEKKELYERQVNRNAHCKHGKLLKRACVRSKVLLIFSYFSSSQALAEAQC